MPAPPPAEAYPHAAAPGVIEGSHGQGEGVPAPGASARPLPAPVHRRPRPVWPAARGPPRSNCAPDSVRGLHPIRARGGNCLLYTNMVYQYGI